MNKLPKLPFEIIVLICEYTFVNPYKIRNEITLHKPSIYIYKESKELDRYWVVLQDTYLGYSSFYKIAQFLYKEIYFHGGAPG
jgi:hypothetical protein